MGCYHGKYGFDNLSHLRGCLIKQLKMEGMNKMRYPPHTADKLGWARFFILKHVDFGSLGRMALLALMAVFVAVFLQVTDYYTMWNKIFETIIHQRFKFDPY